MSEGDEVEVVSADSDKVTESVSSPPQLAMLTRRLPWCDNARKNNALVLGGAVGMHAKLSEEGQRKLMEAYLSKANRDFLPQHQLSILPDKFSLQQADTELTNAFVAAHNVLMEGATFGPKSANAQKAKQLGGMGGRVYVPFESDQRPNEPSNASLDTMIQVGSAEGASKKEIAVKEAAEAVKLFRITVEQVALSLLLDPLPAPEWTASGRKIYVFPKSVVRSTISPLIQSFESSKTQVGTEDNLTLKKLRTALETVCEVKSRVPQALGKLSTTVRGADENLLTWAHRVSNAAKTLQAELETDLVRKEHPNAITAMPRVLWYILMSHQTSRVERAFLKKLVEDKNSVGRRSDKGFSFEPWRDDETWKEFLLAFKGPDFAALKGPSRSDRKEVADTIPVMPGEAAKRRKTDSGRQAGNSAHSGAQSATQSAAQKTGTPKAAGHHNLGQSHAQSAGPKKQVQLSPKELLECKSIIESATKPTKRADGSVVQEVSPPCAICRKFFPSIKVANSSKFLYDGHATYKCRMVQLNTNGEAYQTKKRNKIPKKRKQP